MSDRDLSDLLERAAGRVAVGPAPIDAMLLGAARARRRRTLTAVLGSAAAVAVVVTGAAALDAPERAPGPNPPAASSGQDPQPVPAGTRLVGLGHAAIAVPEEWGTNDTRCGEPQKDTVVIDVGAVETCLTPRPADVDSVELSQGEPRFDFHADETFAIDGVEVERQETTCEPGGFDGREVCAGTVRIPSMRVSFRAESSTGAAEVDRILTWIRIVPERVGVPGFQMTALKHQERAADKYVEALEAAGLSAEVRTRKVPALEPGHVLDVAPAPGTMLEPGSGVEVTVSGAPDGPADEVRVGMNSVDTADNYKDLDDPEVRAGASIELGVGDRIWAYAQGKRASTLAGELDGSSLQVDGWKEGPNYPHSWVAVQPGRTRITLSIVADSEPVTLGVVTVDVR